MNKRFKKVDWSRIGYVNVIIGVPLLLFGLSLNTMSSSTETILFLPVIFGLISLLLSDRVLLKQFFFPFSEKSGRGTARYLGLMGLLTYTAGRVITADYVKSDLLVNTGLLLVAAAACWYMIRLVRFKERGL